MKRLGNAVAFVLVVAAVCLVSVGRASVRVHHPAPRSAAAIVAACARRAGAIATARDGNLGGEAWWLNSHFEWGYLLNNYGRVTGLVLALRQGFVPWHAIASCLPPRVNGGLR